MSAFNYRAYNLELDVCDNKHGFWLDEGEAIRVREIVEERVEGLERAAKAEAELGQVPRRPQGRRPVVLGPPHRQGLTTEARLRAGLSKLVEELA